MITEYDTEMATIVLPVGNIDEDTHYRLNANVGSSTLIEINSSTTNSTEFLIDYSLLDIEDMADAESHLTYVHRDMLDVLGVA